MEIKRRMWKCYPYADTNNEIWYDIHLSKDKYFNIRRFEISMPYVKFSHYNSFQMPRTRFSSLSTEDNDDDGIGFTVEAFRSGLVETLLTAWEKNWWMAFLRLGLIDCERMKGSDCKQQLSILRSELLAVNNKFNFSISRHPNPPNFCEIFKQKKRKLNYSMIG